MQEILGNGSRTNLLVIYDHNGARSMDAAAYFQGHGFENVKSLRGGIDAWSAEVDPKLPRYHLEQDMNDDLETRIEEAVKNPQNLGEMEDADADRHGRQRRLRRHAADVGEIQGRRRPQSDRSRDLPDLRLPDGDRGGQRRDGNARGENGGGSAIDVGRRSGRAAGRVAAGEDSLRAIGGRRAAFGLERGETAAEKAPNFADTLLGQLSAGQSPTESEDRPR